MWISYLGAGRRGGGGPEGVPRRSPGGRVVDEYNVNVIELAILVGEVQVISVVLVVEECNTILQQVEVLGGEVAVIRMFE